MSESHLRRALVQRLRTLDALAVENPTRPGTPDINFIGGWIECKFASRWPPRGGPLRLPHYTKQQRIWHRRRWERGGWIYVALQVGQEVLMIDGFTAHQRLGHEIDLQEEMRWQKMPTARALLAFVSGTTRRRSCIDACLRCHSPPMGSMSE